MTDLKPPTPPNPAHAAKGLAGVLKGKPAWMWVAGVTVLIGVAYAMWHRNTAAAETADAQGTPEGAAPTAVGGATDPGFSDYGPIAGDASGYTTPAPVQGAFGGYSTPQEFAGPGSTIDAAGAPEGDATTGGTGSGDLNLTVNYPGPTSAVGAHTKIPSSHGTHSGGATGGGKHPVRHPSHHKPVHKKPAHHKPAHKPAHHAAPKPKHPVATTNPPHHKKRRHR